MVIEDKKLFLLQTRNGKRTGAAAVRIAVELVQEGLLSKEEAILRVDPNALNQEPGGPLSQMLQSQQYRWGSGFWRVRSCES